MKEGRVAARVLLACGSSILALSALADATPALAQEVNTQSTGQQIGQQSTTSSDTSPDTTVGASATPASSDIVVTARRQAIQNATARKKNSDTVIDSVVADEAGKLPDTSLTEVLQRVSGVTISRFSSLGSPDQFSFEGSGIQIRGLSGVTGLLNGREIFSANGGSGLNWGDVTPELMAAVDVYKASTAELIEGGIGGAIDLRTRMPFDYNKPEFDATVGGSYGDFAKKVSPSVSALLTDRWQTPIGQIGALIDLSYSDFKYADSFVRAEPYYQTTYNGQQVFVPGGFDYGNDTFDRKRRGLYAAFQWKPSDTLTLFQTDFVANYKQQNGGGGVFAVDDESDTVVSGTFDGQGVFQNGVIASRAGTGFYPGNSNTVDPSNTTTADFSQGFTWAPSRRFALRGAVQVVHSTASSDNYGLGVGSAPALQEGLDFTGSLPAINFNGTGDSILDPTQAATQDVIWNHQRNRARMVAENLDGEFDLGDGFFKKLKGGARYADRSETDDFTGTYWSATGRGWNGVPQGYASTSPASDFYTYDFPNFFKGKIPVPSSYIFSNPEMLESEGLQHLFDTYTSCSPSGTGQTYCDPAVSLYSDDSFGNAPSTVTTKTTTFDAYAEMTFGHEGGLPFTGNIGLRVVHDTVSSAGVFTFNGGTNYYQNEADADASAAAVGGEAGLAAYQAANPGATLPYALVTQQTQAARSESNRYTRYLPSFNINFKPNSKFIVRFAANETISPPNFNDIRSTGSSGVVTTPNPNGVDFPGIFSGYSYSAGDAKLKPAMSTNEDISIEWYPKASTTAHIDFFNKAIKNLIIYNDVDLDLSTFFGGVSPISVGPSGPVVVPGTVNGTADFNASQISTIKGIEVGGRTYFDMLPGVLKGIGVDANFTYIDSHSPSAVAYDMQGNTLTDVPIVGLSKYNVNATLLYDLGKVDARLSYSWRSRYLATTSGNGTTGTYALNGGATTTYSLPVYGSAFGSLDASISYKFNDTIGVSIDGANLLDNVSKTEMEILPGKIVTRSWFINDRRVSATLHIHI